MATAPNFNLRFISHLQQAPIVTSPIMNIPALLV